MVFWQMTVVLTWRAASRLFGCSGDLAFSAMQRRVLSKSASTSSTVFPMISRAAGLFRYGANFRNLPRKDQLGEVCAKGHWCDGID